MENVPYAGRMSPRRDAKRTRKDWIVERAAELGISLDELAQRAGIVRQTLYQIRDGRRGHPRTMRNIEAQLRWAPGSLDDIDAGREPTLVDVAAVLARPAFQPPATDPREQLRAIRRQLGPVAFWTEIGVMQAEEKEAYGA